MRGRRCIVSRSKKTNPLDCDLCYIEKHRRECAESDRDAALSAMWGMICCASELRESVRKFAYYQPELQAKDGF